MVGRREGGAHLLEHGDLPIDGLCMLQGQAVGVVRVELEPV